MHETTEAGRNGEGEQVLADPTTKKRGRKWMFALPLLALGTLWLLAEPLSRSFLVKTAESDYRVAISLEEYDLGATLTSLSLGGLKVRDLDSREVLSLSSFRVEADPWAGTERDLSAEVELDGLALTLWREADDQWNLAHLPREKPESAPKAEGGELEGGAGESAKKSRRILVSLVVRDSSVRVLGPENSAGGRETVWEGDLAFETELQLDSRGTLEAQLTELVFEAPFLAAQLAGGLGVEGAGSTRVVNLDELRGQLSVAPVALAELLELELPADFEEDARESLGFKLAGSMTSFEWPAVLDHLDGTFALGVAGCTFEGFSLDGKLTARTRPDLIEFSGEFESNEGMLAVVGTLLPNLVAASEAEPALRVDLTAERVRAGEEAARLFSYIHPAFSLIDDLEDSEIDGLVDGRVALAWGAPIPWTKLFGGEEPIDLTPLTGRGEVAVNQVVIEGSSLLQKLRKELDDDPDAELRLRPLEFALREGRLTYEKPWTWTIGKTETSFEGSVGLDQTLDLSWNVPVTKALVDHYRILRKLEGQRLSIPVRGTTEKPIVEYDSLLQSLGGSLLDEFLPGLTDGDSGAGDSIAGETAESLFERAEALWDAEQFAEAAALYARLRSEYKLSIVYALNRKRIKKREKYQE